MRSFRFFVAAIFALGLASSALANQITPNKGFNQPTPNADTNNWGPLLDTDIGLLDTMLGAVVSVAITTTTQQATAAQAQNLVLKLTGALAGNTVLQLPAASGGFWIIDNETTGAFTLTVTTTAIGSTGIAVPQGARQFLYSDGTNVFAGAYPGGQSPATVLFNLGFAQQARGYIGGCTLSNDGVSPNTVIDISPCAAVADDQGAIMQALAFTKNLNAAWAAGTGNGALDSGSALGVSTWYHLFEIFNPTTVATDFLASQSATAPALPSGYTEKRRVGAVRTDVNSHLLAFTQSGDTFLWAASVADLNAAGIGSTSAQLYTLTVPPGVQVQALFRSELAGSNQGWLWSSPSETDQVPTAGLISLFAESVAQAGHFQILTDTLARVRGRSTAASGTIYAFTYGWIDARGRFN